MILNRVGTKKHIAPLIIKHFPPHRTYIEPFFGAGGLFFQKQKAQYNILNDLDEGAFNFWEVVRYSKDALAHEWLNLPISKTAWRRFKKPPYSNTADPILRAAIFLFYSNYGFVGKDQTMKISLNSNVHQLVLDKIDAASAYIQDVVFMNSDFRVMFDRIACRDPTKHGELGHTFVYCDPPYLGTANNYVSGFTPQDTRDLFDTLLRFGARFAISEFDNPFVLELAAKHNLNVINIVDRHTMKQKAIRREILITNYDSTTLF